MALCESFIVESMNAVFSWELWRTQNPGLLKTQAFSDYVAYVMYNALWHRTFCVG